MINLEGKQKKSYKGCRKQHAKTPLRDLFKLIWKMRVSKTVKLIYNRSSWKSI